MMARNFSSFFLTSSCVLKITISEEKAVQAHYLTQSDRFPFLRDWVTKTGYQCSGYKNQFKAYFSEVKVCNRYGRCLREMISHHHESWKRIANQVGQQPHGKRSGSPQSPPPRFDPVTKSTKRLESSGSHPSPSGGQSRADCSNPAGRFDIRLSRLNSLGN
jgi:hypothetical protein